MAVFNISGGMALTSSVGLAIIEVIQSVKPEALQSWEGVSFKLFLIIALLASFTLNVIGAKWVAKELVPVLKDMAVAAKRLNESTKRCMEKQNLVDLEGD